MSIVTILDLNNQLYALNMIYQDINITSNILLFEKIIRIHLKFFPSLLQIVHDKKNIYSNSI